MDVNRCVQVGLSPWDKKFYLVFEIKNFINLNMHQEINKSRHQQGLCMRISASKKPNAHAL